MRTARVVLAMLLIVSCARSADVTPVKGDAFKADIESITDKQIKYKVDDASVTKPLTDIQKIDFRIGGKAPVEKKYGMVELIDGSKLFCSKWLLKPKQAELTLLTGATIKVPTTAVANILFDASTSSLLNSWKSPVGKYKGKDMVFRLNKEKGTFTGLGFSATIQLNDEDGKEITAALTDSSDNIVTRKFKMEDISGLVFKRSIDPKAPPAKCKLISTGVDDVVVSSVTLTGGKLTVGTPAGASFEYPLAQVATLDFQKGRFDYLVEKEVKEGELKDVINVKGSQTLFDKKPVEIGGKKYYKGAKLLPGLTLEYNLKGEYQRFEGLAGFDGPLAKGVEFPVTLLIEGDNKELLTVKMTKDDKGKITPIALNIKDVQRLKITVKTENSINVATHIAVGDPRLYK